MSGRAPDGDPQVPDTPDRDVLAGEYLLGLLDQEQARKVAGDPASAAAVHVWATLLEPLATLAKPVPPSGLLWQRIANDLPSRAGRTALARAPTSRRAGRLAWRIIGFGGYGLAAGLAAALLLSRHRLDIRIAWDTSQSPVVARPAAPVATPQPGPERPPLPLPARAPQKPVLSAPLKPQAARPQPDGLHDTAVALLTASGADRPAMKAYFTQGGSVRLVSMQAVSLPADKQLGFWVWPHGTALPIPLGRVDSAGGTLRFPFHEVDGTPVMVTLEPRQLPITTAQGPTLFTGQLVAVD